MVPSFLHKENAMAFGHTTFRRNEPLSRHTTFGIGGPALFWYEPVSGELPALFDFAQRARIPLLMLGDGSNCLVSDDGFHGLVVKLSNISVPSQDHGPGAETVSVDAGTNWDMFVRWCCANGYQGIECMSGIPGTVGGAVYGAIGAFGQQIADVIRYVDLIELGTGKRYRRPVSASDFGYRYSVFQDMPDTVIETAGFFLNRGAPACISHPDIGRIVSIGASLLDVANAVLRIRDRKGSLLWLTHRGHNRSAGSFFKNPTVTCTQLEALLSKYDSVETPRWWWPVPDGFRVSAAFLIERAGFRRGLRHGDVGISPEHALSLVNHGHGTANDIIELAVRIRDGVYDSFGVRLRTEVRMIGFSDPPFP